MGEKDIQINIDNYRNFFIKFTSLILFIIALVLGVVHLISPGNYGIGVIIQLVFSASTFVLIIFKKYDVAISYFVFMAMVAIFIQAYIQNSSMVFAVIGLVLIISSLMKPMWVTTMLFIITIIVLLVFLFLGIFTLKQEIDLETGVPLARNIQILIPIIIFSYMFAYVNTKFLLQSIESLRKQNIKIQETQNLLISQTRIESVQILAGGFAHDFNNILTSIMGNLSLSLEDANLEDETREYLEDANSASLQARFLANQLLSLSKNRHHAVVQNVNFSDLLAITVKTSLVGRKSKAILDLDENLFGFDGDPIQIGQVIQNLVINADQSTSKENVIQIVTKNMTLSAEENPYNLPIGNYLHVSVIDQGEGIPLESHDKLFDPFFTTKKTGSGLGLAISQSIIMNHHGILDFESKLGQGSTFYFILPAVVLSPSETLEESIVQAKYSGLSLILDDNPTVLKVIENMLKKFGVETICISESTSFLKTLNKLVLDKKMPDLVILDLTMPGDVGGKNLVNKVRKITPTTSIIASSGYSDDFVIENYSEYGFDDILRKPYSMNDLGKVLEKFLKD